MKQDKSSVGVFGSGDRDGFLSPPFIFFPSFSLVCSFYFPFGSHYYRISIYVGLDREDARLMNNLKGGRLKSGGRYSFWTPVNWERVGYDRQESLFAL